MKNTLFKALAKSEIMYYPFSRLHKFLICRSALALGIFLLVAVLPQNTVLAQSDEKVASDFRDRGLTCQRQGNFKQALFYYSRVSVLTPSDPVPFNDMGLMQEYLGMNSEAEASYLKAIELDRKYMPAYSNLGRFYIKCGRVSSAVQYLKQRVELGRAEDPWTLEAQSQLDDIYAEVPALESARIKDQAAEMAQDIEEAKRRLMLAKERNKEVGFDVAYENGMSLLKEGHYDEAIESLESAVALNPRSISAQHDLKRAKYEKEKAILDAQANMDREQVKRKTVSQYMEIMSEQGPQQAQAQAQPAP